MIESTSLGHALSNLCGQHHKASPVRGWHHGTLRRRRASDDLRCGRCEVVCADGSHGVLRLYMLFTWFRWKVPTLLPGQTPTFLRAYLQAPPPALPQRWRRRPIRGARACRQRPEEREEPG